MSSTVSGTPKQFDLDVGREPVAWEWSTREVTLRNVGRNTLWFSVDGGLHWADVAVGTNFDLRMEAPKVLFRTEVGRTRVVGVATL